MFVGLSNTRITGDAERWEWKSNWMRLKKEKGAVGKEVPVKLARIHRVLQLTGVGKQSRRLGDMSSGMGAFYTFFHLGYI